MSFKMNSIAFLLVPAALLASACGASAPTQELVNARAAYDEAAHDPQRPACSMGSPMRERRRYRGRLGPANGRRITIDKIAMRTHRDRCVRIGRWTSRLG